MKRITVEWEEGHHGEKHPRRFSLGDRQLTVCDLIDCWLGPEQRYFKVKADDGDIYILRYDVEGSVWDLALFSRADYLTDRLVIDDRRLGRQ